MVLEKLTSEEIVQILRRALISFKAIEIKTDATEPPKNLDFVPELVIKEEALKWLADICDGDARIALNSLEMTMKFSTSDLEDPVNYLFYFINRFNSKINNFLEQNDKINLPG